MKKISTIVIVVLMLLGTIVPFAASAQYYSSDPYTTYTPYIYDNFGQSGSNYYGSGINYYGTPSYTYGTYGSTVTPFGMVCANLTSDLYNGLTDAMTGGQVSVLQTFLISTGYLQIAFPTGQFGSRTATAIANYQRSYNLYPVTGVADAITRLSIRNVSCGSSIYPSGGYYSGGYYNAPTISSLSNTSGEVGDSITIYGNNFDRYNNTVNFNGVTVTGLSSKKGTSIRFTIPQINNLYNYNYSSNGIYTVGTFPLSVTTYYGTSNAINFTVTSRNCYNNCNNYNQPIITNISPSSGRAGTQVAIYGSGFTANNNTVHFGNGGSMNFSSSNGSVIYYTIPNYISACNIVGYDVACPAYAQQVTPGTYPIYVSNANGQTGIIYFTVTY